ncbi:hypothetical protein J0X19_23870 [Hymenobacter sp. BT186]|uniref:Uncharacterized protein n=1 Tax=Hymenobacter telluris TaxID=2816474 RepID=A0A939F015_9BACT|nr:hypothetical protein [Hymenobacter telluris]MBO0361019.1 hypothetical protein [Hymenobacter telluris]MBW3377047.1 hypothetical protein [Hymenobacter norwichensis]
MATSNSDNSLYQDVSYAQASQAQHTQALRTLVNHWRESFPQVSELHWWQAYHHCQPGLWIIDGELAPEPDMTTQIIAWITLLHGPATDEQDRYAPASIHLARQLNNLPRLVEQVLTTHKEGTTPQAAEAYLQVLRRLLCQDLIAAHLRTGGTFPEPGWQQDTQPISSSQQEVFAWLPDRTEELVALQWESLRDWLNQKQNPLRSWHIGSFSHHLRWTSALIQQIFYGPKEPAQHPELFTLERLTRLQAVLLHHRFSLPQLPL